MTQASNASNDVKKIRMRTVQPDMTTVMDGWSAWVELNMFRPWESFEGSSSQDDDNQLIETLRPIKDSPEDVEEEEENEPVAGMSQSTEEVVIQLSELNIPDAASETDSIITGQGNLPSLHLDPDSEIEIEDGALLLDLAK